MEAAIDIDSADYSARSSHSGAGSRSGASGSTRVTGITGVDVESGEAASLVGGRGHRSIYASVAEEALLGAVSPSEPAIWDSPYDIGQLHRPMDMGRTGYHDADGATWRMGSAGVFWRMDPPGVANSSSFSARCCVTGTDDPGTQKSKATQCPHCILRTAVTTLALAVCVGLWSFFGGQVLRTDSGVRCCTSATARCFACQAEMSVGRFCDIRGAARGIDGCHHRDPCCGVDSAECLSCRAGVADKEFCRARRNHNITGCGDSLCGLVEHGVVYPGGDLYKVNDVQSAHACCRICRDEPKCNAWTWSGESCRLKRQAELKAIAFNSFVSGLPGKDQVEFRIKNRHGLCMNSVFDSIVLKPCFLADAPQQGFWFIRRLKRLASAVDGRCLQASVHRAGPLRLTHCDSTDAKQQWHYNSETGHMRAETRTSNGVLSLCVHASRWTRDGSGVAMEVCSEFAEPQLWNLWNSDLWRLEATQDALQKEEQVTSTTTTVTTTTIYRPTIFCFSVMVSWGYEPSLVRMQVRESRSIFSCDGFVVYSNRVLDLGKGILSKIVQGTDLKAHVGGKFNTLLNTPVFKKVWAQVLADALYLQFEWTAKVDCDAVFFPDRLRALVSETALHRAQNGNGIFLNNCGFGLHGPIEVISRRALQKYRIHHAECGNPMQEDVYLQACMNRLGVQQLDRFILLSEEACRTPHWERCQSEHVSFHPFKDEEAYKQCESRAEVAEEAWERQHV